MAAVDAQSLAHDYEDERPRYQTLVNSVVDRISAAVRREGLTRVEITGRTKDTYSFVRKAIAKGYEQPLAEIHDKAGVRVIGMFLGDTDRVVDLVRSIFTVIEEVDKRQELGEDKLGYGGIHQIIQGGTELGSDLEGLLCEIQVRTRAEDLWARTSHEMLYKGRGVLVGASRRRVFRLAGLVEYFDQDAEEARVAMTQADLLTAGMVDSLEAQFFTLTGHLGVDELTVQVVGGLRDLYTIEDSAAFSTLVGGFVDGHLVKLQEIYAAYVNDPRHPLLNRPEALLVFERLTADPFHLQAAWEAILPPDLLADMASIWGVSLSEQR